MSLSKKCERLLILSFGIVIVGLVALIASTDAEIGWACVASFGLLCVGLIGILTFLIAAKEALVIENGEAAEHELELFEQAEREYLAQHGRLSSAPHLELSLPAPNGVAYEVSEQSSDGRNALLRVHFAGETRQRVISA